MGFVDGAFALQIPLRLASVNPVAVNAPFEKSRTTFNGKIVPDRELGRSRDPAPSNTYRRSCKCRSAFLKNDRRKPYTEYPVSDHLKETVRRFNVRLILSCGGGFHMDGDERQLIWSLSLSLSKRRVVMRIGLCIRMT